MELKSELKQPYTDEERINFIVEQNHKKGYEIKETGKAIEAWGYTEEERQEQQQKSIGELSMTRADVFEALILAKGVSKANLRTMIENFDGLSDLDRALYLNRFDEALEFYRKHPAINLIGGLLGISSKQLDNFFVTKNWEELVKE